METPDLLTLHAQRWAEKKNRMLDGELLETVVDLRLEYDDEALGMWPSGSAERLLLVTWPAYGPGLPDLDRLKETLDTFWGFLRATGRMSSASASPADLRKEARRALPKMQAAVDDPANHSQGRVLADFGRSIGVDLDGAADMAELQGRLDKVTEAWNGLPTEERRRLMPDPSPKSRRGEGLTAAMGKRLPTPDAASGRPRSADEGEDDVVAGGDVRKSAGCARTSGFVRNCLALADWVGDARAVTQTGVLRPAVAREAYRHLDLWPWERARDAAVRSTYGLPAGDRSDEADRLMADAALHAWRSAGECLPLDRLWYACDAAGLVEVGATVARRSKARPESDEEWRDLALVLLMGLCLRLGPYALEPLLGVLLMALDAGVQEIPLGALREWWESRCPESLRDLVALGWSDRLDLVLHDFADCELWRINDEHYQLTDLGRDFAITYLNALEAGLLEE